MWQHSITRPSNPTWTQSFNYTDGLNRLNSAQETTAPSNGANWTESYGYDSWSNRWLAGYTSLPTVTPETHLVRVEQPDQHVLAEGMARILKNKRKPAAHRARRVRQHRDLIIDDDRQIALRQQVAKLRGRFKSPEGSEHAGQRR